MESLGRSKPQHTTTVPVRAANLDVRQSIGGRVVTNVAGGRVESVESLAGPDVDPTPLVLGEAPDVVAGQAVRGRQGRDVRGILGWIVDSTDAAFGTRDPQSSAAIGMERSDGTSGHASGGGEDGKAPRGVPCDAARKHPERHVAGEVLREGLNPQTSRQSFALGVGVKPRIVPIP